MIVDQHHSCRAYLQSAFDNFTWIHGRVVDRAHSLQFVGDEAIALVEEKYAELLALGEGHRGAAIFDDVFPRSKRRPLAHSAARQAPPGRLDDLDVSRGGIPDAVDFQQPLAPRAQYFCKGAEACNEVLGEGFDVAARNRAEQDQFQQFVIGNSLVATLKEARTQPVASPQLDAPAPERDAAILELFYSTGMRLSELVALNVEDIDTYSETVRVFGKGSKERICPVGSKALEAVQRYRAKAGVHGGALFLSKLRKQIGRAHV